MIHKQIENHSQTAMVFLYFYLKLTNFIRQVRQPFPDHASIIPCISGNPLYAKKFNFFSVCRVYGGVACDIQALIKNFKVLLSNESFSNCQSVRLEPFLRSISCTKVGYYQSHVPISTSW